VKLYKPGTLSRVTVARKPDLLESCFGPLGNLKTVHGDRHGGLLLSMDAINSTKQLARCDQISGTRRRGRVKSRTASTREPDLTQGTKI
jgi:hypothetical protein